MVSLVDGVRRWQWLERAMWKSLLEDLEKLGVELNRGKIRRVDLAKGESFSFQGFDMPSRKTRRGQWGLRTCRA